MTESSTQHEMIQAVKDLAIQLGKTPTRGQFIACIKGGDYKLIKVFGSYSVLLKAAGLDTYEDRRSNDKKIDNSIFNKSIDDHLENYIPTPTKDRGVYPTIASISDIHWPFDNPKVIKAFQQYCGDVKPQTIFINGDAWDMFSNSRFPRSQNIFTPREERDSSLKKNTEFWEIIKKVTPKSKCYQMLGNHDIRPLKRVLESYPAAEDWIAEALKKDFTFNGVETIFDPREEVIIEDILIFHGYRSGIGAHRDYTLMNTINGHIHLGGVSFRRLRGQTLWELNSGLAGDPESKGLSYTPQKITHWTPGFGVVTPHGPQFIPI